MSDVAASREQRELMASAWPLERVGEAMEELARRASLTNASTEALAPAAEHARYTLRELGEWMEWAGSRLGIEAESVETTYGEVGGMLQQAGPTLIVLPADRGAHVFLLLRSRGRRLRLLGPDLRVRRCAVEPLRAILCARFETPLIAQIDTLLATAGVPAARRAKARAAMLAQRLATERIDGFWVLRLPASANIVQQARHARLHHRLLRMLGLFGAVYCIELAGWTIIGRAALDGRLDLGWLVGWVLLSVTLLPLRLAGGWQDAMFALDGSRLLKQRMLAGALRMPRDEVGKQGAGHLLGRVMETQALESLAVNGGLGVLVAAVELALAAWVLGTGAGGAVHVGLLLAWVAIAVLTSRQFVRKLRRWTRTRLALTQELVERMVGHRTCLAQERAERRDPAQDRAMQDYLDAAQGMDRGIVPVTTLVSRGWMLVGLAGLVPAFVTGSATSASLAIGLGGIMLANRALGGISDGISSLGRAAMAWEQVAPMFRAGANVRPSSTFRPLPVAHAADAPSRAAVIDARGLTFRYSPQTPPVLRGVDLEIRHGERILLEGASGGGKSTLAALLTGMRTPESGLLLLDGLDRHTLGDHWHRLATSAPQFHENHVLGGTLAFNLLMGHQWPASEEDLAEATELCEELGLGDLIRRMPSGLMQTVGETGWQLSHGERSRIFLARALLQKAPLTIMDESFAALDPETLARCLRTAFVRTDALVVIAHP